MSKKEKSGKGSFIGVFVAIVMAICSVKFLPTTMLFIVGIIPTAVAFFVDSSREKTLGPTVLFLNFAGLLPSLIALWRQGHTVANALSIMTEPFRMLMDLMPAAFGWMLYLYIPLLATVIVRRNAELRIKALQKEQDYLVEQWGNSFVTTPSTPVETKSLPAPQEGNSSANA